ncbi:MAG: ABC transporter ATP-binding protein [Planctomycetes bacterium]|nr:ABC transporter ATP-binding protein [Planctomycetota bacterium]
MSARAQQLGDSATQRLSPPLPDDVVLSVRGVSKKFCRHLRRSMAYGIIDLSKNLLGVRPDSSGLRKAEFWALDDVSLELRRGEILGLIGPNGSGKTTLLRLMAGIFPPDKGEISVRGRVGALISLGAGFHPHMTGRENIYLNGAILGMSRAEIRARFDDIVDFAEIGEFIDAPVATYSSGMYVRLGFAIAVHVDPAILLVDEVISVGDTFFRHKCMRRIQEITAQGTAAIFVSHVTDRIRAICDRGMVIEKGRVQFLGESERAVDIYLRNVREREAERAAAKLRSSLAREEMDLSDPGRYRPRGFPPAHAFEYGPARQAEIVNVEIVDENAAPVVTARINDHLNLRIYVHTKAEVRNMGASFLVRDESGVDLLGTTSHHYGYTVERADAGRILVFSFGFRNLLRPGHYSISAAVNYLQNPDIPVPGTLIHQFDNIAGFASLGLPELDVYHRLYTPVEVGVNRPEEIMPTSSNLQRGD